MNQSESQIKEDIGQIQLMEAKLPPEWKEGRKEGRKEEGRKEGRREWRKEGREGGRKEGVYLTVGPTTSQENVVLRLNKADSATAINDRRHRAYVEYM